MSYVVRDWCNTHTLDCACARCLRNLGSVFRKSKKERQLNRTHEMHIPLSLGIAAWEASERLEDVERREMSGKLRRRLEEPYACRLKNCKRKYFLFPGLHSCVPLCARNSTSKPLLLSPRNVLRKYAEIYVSQTMEPSKLHKYPSYSEHRC